MEAEPSRNLCTVLIGKNGTGKSRLLASICEAYVGRRLKQSRSQLSLPEFEANQPYIQFSVDEKPSSISLTPSGWNSMPGHSQPDKNDSDNLPGPSKVIAVTVSPFDKFPLDNLQNKRISFEQFRKPREYRRYVYLGQRNYGGQITQRAKIDRIADSLLHSLSAESLERSDLESVFKLLHYKPTIRLLYRSRLNRRDLDFVLSLRPQESDINDLVGILQRNNIYLDKVIEENGYELLAKLKEVFSMLVGRLDHAKTFDITIPISEITNAELKRAAVDAQFLRSLNLIQLDDAFVAKEGVFTGSLSQASSGEQSLLVVFIGIASEISDNALVIIDEPEISLHPEWQSAFVGLLEAVFCRYSGCHFVLATHSPQILSAIGSLPCAVIDMDSNEITDAHAYWKKSADFQLVEAFGSPGYRNEYLVREALTAIQFISQGEFDDPEFQRIFAVLEENKDKLQRDDPVRKMIVGILEAVEAHQK
jgi:predicted ATPase